jgi:hypothetical protein
MYCYVWLEIQQFYYLSVITVLTALFFLKATNANSWKNVTRLTDAEVNLTSV